MTETIAETRVRAQVQEYDGRHYLRIEARAATAWEWRTVSVFSADSEVETVSMAQRDGWAWLVGSAE